MLFTGPDPYFYGRVVGAKAKVESSPYHPGVHTHTSCKDEHKEPSPRLHARTNTVAPRSTHKGQVCATIVNDRAALAQHLQTQCQTSTLRFSQPHTHAAGRQAGGRMRGRLEGRPYQRLADDNPFS